ncbi:MAG: hypothetical protein JSV24_11230 [Bacteroidales bacterium]|nr:MAG: hypothetical protein JSV24_11230 [Bacteroidales bacterium]
MSKIVKFIFRKDWLKPILILVSVHSFAIGSGLIFMPGKLMPFWGLTVPAENFFQIQGGILHYILAIAYFMAATGYNRYQGLLILAIITKFLATLFLFSFYLFVERAWIILVSGIIDYLMGLTILWGFLHFHWNMNDIDIDFPVSGIVAD